MCFCGYQVITSIQNLIRAAGSTSFTLTPQTRSYGLQVTEWVTPFISVDFITHPLFSYEPSLTRRAVFFHPEDLVYRYIDDTQYITSMTDKNVGSAWVDGKHEGWLTEAGLEFHHPTKCMILDGFGQDNPA